MIMRKLEAASLRMPSPDDRGCVVRIPVHGRVLDENISGEVAMTGREAKALAYSLLLAVNALPAGVVNDAD